MSSPNQASGKSSSDSNRRGFAVSGAELWQWWRQARQQAIASAIPPTEVDWLLQELAGLERLELRLETFKDRTDIRLKQSLDDVIQLWQQRIQKRIPVQYLTGTAPWREFSLKVSPAVLIPRPETEMVIDLAVQGGGEGEWGDGEMRRWGDNGNKQKLNLQSTIYNLQFSSLIPYLGRPGNRQRRDRAGLAAAFPQATIHAVDCSAEALAIAQANAAAYNLTDRIHFYQGSWLEPLQHLKGQLSGIVSNPPYIPSAMVPDLQPEVAHHEPHLALDGGADGLSAIRKLVAEAPEYLRSNGLWLVEMMAGQAEAVAEMLHQQGGYRNIQIHTDLAGIERFVIAYRE